MIGRLLLSIGFLAAQPLPSTNEIMHCVNNDAPLLVVVWHGINSDCCTANVAQLVEELDMAFPETYIKSIKIGDSVKEDFLRSFFGNVNDQVDAVCKMLKGDEALKDGFHAVGLSQGGQFFRAYVERCNDPPVKMFFTFGSQHQGVMRFPGCLDGVERPAILDSLAQAELPGMVAGNFGLTCNQLDALLKLQVYKPATQASIIPAQYVKVPERMEEYLRFNKFLPDINNEHEKKNPVYKKNMASLEKFVMYMFDDEDVVIPKESSHFGFFNGTHMLSMEEQSIYQEDWIGLKELNERGDLIRETLPGMHVEFATGLISSCLKQYIE